MQVNGTDPEKATKEARAKLELALCLEKLDTNTRQDIEEFLEIVANKITWWMKSGLHRVHFVRWRIKSEASIADKIIRSWTDKTWKNNITAATLFSDRLIPDFAACRILVLYRDDIALVHEAIMSEPSWTVIGDPTAHVLETRASQDRSRYEAIDIKIEKVLGYESVHYTLKSTNKPLDHVICELQVRTVQQEAWSEFSHDIKYPEAHKNLDELASRLVDRVSEINHVSEDLIDEIRRCPIQASAGEEILKAALSGEPLSFTRAAEVLATTILPGARYLNRSAPFSVFGLLSPTVESDTSFGHLEGQARRVVSLDFSLGGSFWNRPSRQNKNYVLNRSYLEVQSNWKEATAGRSITKYFVCAEEDVDIDKTFLDTYQGNIQMFVIPKTVHDRIMARSRDTWHSTVQNPFGWQFVVWLTQEGELAEAKLKFLGAPNQTAYGFYTPDRSADLLTSVSWVTQRDNARASRLRKCIDVLESLKGTACAVRLSDWRSRGGPNDGDTINALLEDALAKPYPNA
jgi:ppGpp synthetase/RelA/SpoT-type nucleotidyltranferase